jgi:tetratricopeptide (TPR) repeat protein
MSKPIRSLAILATAGLLVLLCSGCTRKARSARAMGRADRYFEAGHYDAAEIEYLNALRNDRANPVALGRLGIIYFDEGRLTRSFPFLLAGRQLQPNNLDVRLKLGLSFLAVGKLQEARDEANFILGQDPQQGDAPILLAEASLLPDEIEHARQALGRLPDAESSPVLVALGTLDFRQRQFDKAEASFKQALVADPKFSSAYTALGALYWEEKDLSRAAAAFAKAAELAPAQFEKELQYAQFEIKTGKRDEGRRSLEDIIQKAPGFLPASVLLGELDEAEKKYDEGAAIVAKVLERDRAYPDALLLSARLKLAQGQPDQAVAELERAEIIYPHYPQIEYGLAQAYLAVGATEKASSSLNKVLLWAPNITEAAIALAKIDLQTGDPGAAIISLKKIIQKHPELIEPRLLLANTYVGQNDFDDALAVYRQIAAAAPRNSQPIVLMGRVLLRKNLRVDARQAFDAALELNPGYFPAVEQLVLLDLADRQYDEARRLAEKQIARNSAEAAPYILLARVYLAQKAWPEAEAALLKAIQIEPNSSTAYFFVAELYFVTHQDQKALADLQRAVAKNPRDRASLMLMGAIEDRQKDHSAARDAYEKVLAIDPDFSPALNNLAYLYSEDFGQLDKAFDMAQKARLLLPSEPHAADTLGWILYKKRQFPWALSLLRDSAINLPDDAEIQFHLGMTEYILGEEAPARAALENALRLSKDFPGSDDASQRLSVLGIDPAKAGPDERSILEKAAADRPDDPVVLARVAAIYEHSGAPEKAITTYEAMLVENPNNLTALTRLAQLYAARQDTAKAFELAKTAHNLAPNDPEASHVLGRLAYRTGDYPWAASLLRDSAGKKPNDPEVLLDLAEAFYGVGQIADAETALQGALDADPRFSRADEAARDLELIRLPDNPSPAAIAEVQPVIGKDPEDLPALIARARISERSGDLAAAKLDYENALSHYPAFFPAEKSLIILYAQHPANDKIAPDLVSKAREAFPGDPEVAKAAGIIAYRQGDYRRAANILGESATQRADDGEGIFYLGMAQHQLKDKSSAKTLQRALGLNLKPDLAAEARRTLTAAGN